MLIWAGGRRALPFPFSFGFSTGIERAIPFLFFVFSACVSGVKHCVLHLYDMAENPRAGVARLIQVFAAMVKDGLGCDEDEDNASLRVRRQLPFVLRTATVNIYYQDYRK